MKQQKPNQAMDIKIQNQEFKQAAGAVILSLFVVYGILWAFTKDSLLGSSTYNSYVLQAQRWLQGHLDLDRDYDYLEIARYQGRYYVSFPPIPSVILLPFVAVFGLQTPDHFIAVLIGVLGTVYALRLVLSAGISKNAAVLWTLLLTVGGNFLHIGYRADVWYFAQCCAFTFTMMSLYFALYQTTQLGWLSLFFWALAVGCRPLNAVYFPLVLHLLWQNYGKEVGIFRAVRQKWWWILPPLLVGGFLMLLNGLRFGNIFEFGHNYLPEFAEESPNGQFWIGYIPQNLHRMFRLPALENHRLVFQIFDGTALWLVSPIFLAWFGYGIKHFKDSFRSPIFWLSFFLPVLHLLFLCAHKTLGGWQFGNRYTVDLLPAVFLGLVLLLKKEANRLPLWLYAMLLWGMGLNLVGTITLMEAA